MMNFNSFFVIVGIRDNPMYEAEFGSLPRQDKHMNQFILHSALDVVEESMWITNSMYLKTVDRFNEWYISAYVTASNIKFLLLHDAKNEENIKNFFTEVHEYYLKVLLNPFHKPDGKIMSKSFDAKVKQLGKKYL